MGQESSSPVDEATPPRTLQSRTLEGLAGYIRDGRAKRVVVMTGAGISTSAGIPDFRSPTTGLYANLARLNLPYAEAVFDISYFRQNPRPFYTLAHELYPGKYRPTITHCFIRLLHDKGLLLKLFTQNIDCLEREAGVPDDKIVEAHGSFARQSCIECKTPYPDDLIRKHIDEMAIPY
ncbi:Sir2 histone deacetylase Hst2, partial [Cryomyces antarcticus]